MKDVFSIQIGATPEDVYRFLSEKEKITRWIDMDSARFEFSFEGPVKTGDQVTIIPIRDPKSWKMVGECIDVVPGKRVVWEFIEGPLAGTESWVAKPKEAQCIVHKILDYEVTGLRRRLIWRLFGRKLHSRSCEKELNTLRQLVEKSGR